MTNIPQAPTYRPTKIEFDDPLLYIQSIRAEAQQYGICKIIPPDDWRPPPSIDLKNLRFTTRKQRIDLLQCRDLDAAKVEFLTRLIVFWQNERKSRLLAHLTNDTDEPMNQNSNTHSNSHTPRRRRSESQLLADPRRRPLTNMDQYQTSPMLKELHAHVDQTAAQMSQARASRSKGEAPIGSKSPSSNKKDKREPSGSPRRVSALVSNSQGSVPISNFRTGLLSDDDEDDQNFTLDGVSIKHGELIYPRLHKFEIDLFLLYEFVTQRFGGFIQVTKRNWSDLVKLMQITSNLMHAQDQFRSNYNDPHVTPIANSSPSKKVETDQLLEQGDELRKIYRTYLLPYEEYVEQHKRGVGPTTTKTPSNKGHNVHIDKKDIDDSTPHPSHGHPNESELPLPVFSSAEVKRWSELVDRRPKEGIATSSSTHSPPILPNLGSPLKSITSTTDASPSRAIRCSITANSPLPTSSTKAKISDSSDPTLVCVQCRIDSAAPSSQCYHCQRVFHWSCLSPPLLSSPCLPFYCPDCLSAGSFGFEDGELYDFPSYESRANEFKHSWFLKHRPDYLNKKCPYQALHKQTAHDTSPSKAARPNIKGPCLCKIPTTEVVKQYWKIVEGGHHAHPVTVEYGSDLDTTEIGSGFPTAGLYARSGWNLNNLPKVSHSILKHLTNISGVTSPWLYVGMCFSSFCWHAEDHYTYSINYVHQGEPKHWYGIPSSAATAFEAVARQTLPHLFTKQPDLFFQMVTMLSPNLLQAKGVPVFTLTQSPGEFILTFPQAYHGGFNLGVNIAEAVNFAPPDWLPFALKSVERYRCYKRTPVFSTNLLLMSLARDPVLDDQTAAWLLPCLKHAREEEVVMREHIRVIGITKAKRWTAALHMALFGDQHGPSDELVPLKYQRGKLKGKYQGRKVAATNPCVYCRHALHTSAIWCECRPTQVACLRHAHHLCSCGPSQQTLLMRYHIDELDRLIGRVQHQLESVPAEKRIFYPMNLTTEDPIESIDDIIAECEQCLQDTEIPVFCSGGYEEIQTISLVPSYGHAPSKNQTRKRIRDKEMFQQIQALHKTYQFLIQTADEHSKAIDESNLLNIPINSTSTHALDHIRSALYPIRVVLTPRQRHLITSPPILQIRNLLDKRIEKWLKQLKPFLLAEFQLKRQHEKKVRAEKRKQGLEVDSSDSESDDDDEDDKKDAFTIEPFNFNGDADGNPIATENDIEMEEDELDHELHRIVKLRVFNDSSSTTANSTKKSAPSKLPRLSLTQLDELLIEGSSLIWSTTHSRAVNLVYHKLSQWARLVEQIHQMGMSTAAATATSSSTPSSSNSKVELSTARRLIHASAYAPIDFTSIKSTSKDSSSSEANDWSARIASHMKNLKQQVTETERVESKLKQVFDFDCINFTIADRQSNPALLTLESFYELQEQVNGLPLTFPLASKLASLIVRMGGWINRGYSVVHPSSPVAASHEPNVPIWSMEQVLRFSPKYRPWKSNSMSDVQDLSPTTPKFTRLDSEFREPGEVDDVDSARSCLIKLNTFPLRHPIYQLLDETISKVKLFGDRARRLLFFSPGQAVLKDSEAFETQADLIEATRLREHGGPQLKFAELQSMMTELHGASIKPKGVHRRFEKFLKEMDDWQKNVCKLFESCIRFSKHVNSIMSKGQAATNSHGTTKLSAQLPTAASLIASLEELKEELDGFGVIDIPGSDVLLRLQSFPMFESRLLTYFCDPLNHSYPSSFYNFQLFQPAVWLKQLDTIFQENHPPSNEWKQQTWKKLLEPYFVPNIKDPATSSTPQPKSDPSKNDSIGSSTKLTPSKRPSSSHPVDESQSSVTKKSKVQAGTVKNELDTEMTESPSKLTSSNSKKRPASATIAPKSGSSARMKDVGDDDDSGSNSESDDGPQEIRRSGRVTKRRLNPDEEEEKKPHGTPIKVEDSKSLPMDLSPKASTAVEAKVVDKIKQTKPTLYDMYQLFQEGQQFVRSSITASSTSLASSANSPTLPNWNQLLTECVGLVQIQLAQLDSFFQLVGRLHQHTSHILRLKEATHDLTRPDRTIQVQNFALKQLELLATNPQLPPHHHLDCPYYLSPLQCPFYTIVEMEKLYVIYKALQGFGVSLTGFKQVKDIYNAAYRFQLEARRLKATPHLTTQLLLLPDNREFDTKLREHLAEVSQALSPLTLPADVRRLTNSRDPFWKDVAARVRIENSLELNMTAWSVLLNAEAKLSPTGDYPAHAIAPFSLTRTVHATNSIWMPTPGPRPVQHHSLLIHPIHHAAYQDLAAKYHELVCWTERAANSCAHLRLCIRWAQQQPEAMVSLNTSTVGLVQSTILPVADTLIEEGQRKGFHSNLLRKLRQGRWSVRTFEALIDKKPIDTLIPFIGTHEAYKAMHTKKERNLMISPPNLYQPTAYSFMPLAHVESITNSSVLKNTLEALPMDEFDFAPWIDRLREVVGLNSTWLQEAQVYLATLNAYELQTKSKHNTLDPPLHFDQLAKFVRSAPAGPTTISTEYKQLSDRVKIGRGWIDRVEEWLMEAKRPKTSNAHSATSTSVSNALHPSYGTTSHLSLQDPSNTSPQPNEQESRVSMKNLDRLITAGRQSLLMTNQLQLILSLQHFNQRWVQQVDRLFQPRHHDLTLRNLLLSLLVPITAEHDKEKMKEVEKKIKDVRITARHPVPDCNGYYCICKREYIHEKFMIACDTCGVWYHGACLGVRLDEANRLNEFACPKCCDKQGRPFQFGIVNWRGTRPGLSQCQALLNTVETNLNQIHPYASELVMLEHVRGLRNVLSLIDEFKAYIAPWLKVTEHEIRSGQFITDWNTPPLIQPLPPYNAQLFLNGTLHPSRVHPSQLYQEPFMTHLKGLIRQGKKFGINFSELSTIKKRYELARDLAKANKAQANAAANGSASTPFMSTASHLTPSTNGHPINLSGLLSHPTHTHHAQSSATVAAAAATNRNDQQPIEID